LGCGSGASAQRGGPDASVDGSSGAPAPGADAQAGSGGDTSGSGGGVTNASGGLVGSGGQSGAAGTGNGGRGAGGSAGNAGGSSGSAGAGGSTGVTGCKALTIERGKSVANYVSDSFTWSDAACRPRSAALVHNDAMDPANEFGGYARRFTYEFGGKVRTCDGTGAGGWQGFGYIVTHYADTAETTQSIKGTFSTPLAGKHHALHEYHWTIHPGGDVNVTVQWFFATGRSNPLYAITFDATPAGPDVVSADTRAPYGDVGWDMNMGSNVDGVGWGDKYKLVTTGNGPLTPASSWDYSKTNIIPYDLEWSNTADAEMGAVATLPWETRNAGGDYGSGTLATKWGKTGTNLLDAANLPDWLWPFQLDQYELPFVTTSKRLAWGASYGAVGQTKVNAFGKTVSGYPYQSYSVYVVLGAHSAHAVDAQVAEIEAVQRTVFSATAGTVATDGPAGLRRTDRQSYTPKGFNPIYGAWEVAAPNGTATMSFDVAQGSLKNPVVLVTGFAATAAPAHVRLGGRELAADTDYFMTVDTAGKRLWLTLNATLSGKTELVLS
jgi:hypothetical protein